jgi:Pyruvate/2-oxoacid:ferredoxin oxidoreductase delta subunit
MGHIANIKDIYEGLQVRLDKNPIGAPRSSLLYTILKLLYDKDEAFIASRFPLGRATLTDLVKATGIEREVLKEKLDTMARKGQIIDYSKAGINLYFLAPTMIGLFEFTFMRTREDIPQKELANLLHDYFREGGMGKEVFGSKTQRTRTLVHERAVPQSEVFTYERALDMIKHYKGGAVTMCYCRHTALHRGEACKAPMDGICTSFGLAADFLIRRGFARRAPMEELVDILQMAEDHGLVHICDNVQDGNSFICHCCGCCCELLAGVNELRIPHAVAPSRFQPKPDEESCKGCGTCVARCPVHALSLGDATPSVDLNFCLGCGVCASSCPNHAMSMTERKDNSPIPKNWLGLMGRIATEKNRKLV